MSDKDAERYAQADAISLLIEHATTLQSTSNDVLSKLKAAQDAASDLPLKLRHQLTEGLREGLAEPAAEASERMSEQLLAAIQATKRAADRMSALQQSINRRIVLMYLTLTVFALSLIVGMAWYTGVTPWQLDARRAEISDLQATADALHKRGADAQIAECPDMHLRKHSCVRVDQSYGSFGARSDYFVIKGQ